MQERFELLPSGEARAARRWKVDQALEGCPRGQPKVHVTEGVDPTADTGLVEGFQLALVVVGEVPGLKFFAVRTVVACCENTSSEADQALTVILRAVPVAGMGLVDAAVEAAGIVDGEKNHVIEGVGQFGEMHGCHPFKV